MWVALGWMCSPVLLFTSYSGGKLYMFNDHDVVSRLWAYSSDIGRKPVTSVHNLQDVLAFDEVRKGPFSFSLNVGILLLLQAANKYLLNFLDVYGCRSCWTEVWALLVNCVECHWDYVVCAK